MIATHDCKALLGCLWHHLQAWGFPLQATEHNMIGGVMGFYGIAFRVKNVRKGHGGFPLSVGRSKSTLEHLSKMETTFGLKNLFCIQSLRYLESTNMHIGLSGGGVQMFSAC